MMNAATVFNAVALHSAATAMTVLLCAVFTLIAASKRAQIRNMATAITAADRHRSRPAALPGPGACLHGPAVGVAADHQQ